MRKMIQFWAAIPFMKARFMEHPPPGGHLDHLSLSLRNNLEAKMRSKDDTIDELEKVKLLDNLQFQYQL